MTGREILELDPATVERIAAGEVVERPASAVKELLENSLDADASSVEVALSAGGTEGIRVSDDGVGMDEETLRRAVEKHTTSKIRDIEDLEGGVGTLGFRGEALHAIGAVSRLTITSRPRGEPEGTELVLEGGEVTDVSPAGCPEGTTVEVENLFYNVPARRKYLKTESTEFAHANTIVRNYALANPDVSVELRHDGNETFSTTGSGDRRETVLSVYGREVAESMYPVEQVPEGPLADVSGLVSHPETNRASREYLSTFVNGRYVRASAVQEAIVEAYGGQLAADRYPFAVLALELDPATVDVNVHPRKLEVRFTEEAAVRQQVESAVENALLEGGLVRSSAPRGRSAPDQTTIQPGEDGTQHDERQSDDDSTAERAPPETDDASPSESSDSPGSKPRPTATEDAAADAETEPTDEQPGGPTVAGDTGRGVSEGEERSTEPVAGSTDRTDAGTDAVATTDSTGAGQDGRERAGDEPPRDGDQRSIDAGRPSGPGQKFRGGGRQQQLDGTDVSTASFDSLPSMRVLGQFRETYVVAETDDGLVLLDQHAADERVNYERLKERFADGPTTQALAEPVRLELTAGEAELFEAHEEALARLGFHASLDGRVLEVSTVPAPVAERSGPELIRDVIGAFLEGDVAAAATVEAAVEELLADLACYPSVTGNTSLTEGSVRELLGQLDGCENPYACPHGRPVLIELDEDELADRFERDYPGHG